MSTDSQAGSISDAEDSVRNVLLGLMTSVFHSAGRFWVRHGTALGILTLAGFFAVTFIIGWLRPVQAWDMIAYLASAWKSEYASAEALHKAVWEAVRLGTTPEHFLALSEGDAYRMRQFTDPQAFYSQLGMYEVKWLYVQLVGLIAPWVGPMHAGFIINFWAGLFLLCVLIWWMAKVKLLNLAPLVLALLLVAGFPGLALSESPDLLNTAFVVAALLMLDRGHNTAGAFFGVLAVLTRPDSVVLVAGLLGAFWLWRQTGVLALAFAFAASLLAYTGIQAISDHPGWWPHLWFSTYHIQEDMQFFHPDFSIEVYVIAFCWNLIRSAFENSWLGLFIGGLAVWALLASGGLKFGDRRTALIGAAFGAVALKYLLFPLHDGRTYFPMLLPALLLMLAETRDRARDMAGREIEPDRRTCQ